MPFTPELLPNIIITIAKTIDHNADAVTVLDQTLGDGDHVINLQRGIAALQQQRAELTHLDWTQALQKIGMTLLTTMGGASGSLFGTLFISMSKAAKGQESITAQIFADIFAQSVDAVKKRGQSDAGEKTLLDVLIPVSQSMQQSAKQGISLVKFLDNINQVAIAGMESTREMLATKGRASFLGDKSIGCIDAGAKTSQLMICAIIQLLKEEI